MAKPGQTPPATHLSAQRRVTMAKPTKGISFVGLFILTVLLLIIMPALLYLLGWGIKRYTENAPSWIGRPALRKHPNDTPHGDAPVRTRT